MFNIISISELQKAPARTFKNTKGYSFVLSNNKKVWLVISEEMTKALEESWALEKFEDILLSSGNKFLEEKKRGWRNN